MTIEDTERDYHAIVSADYGTVDLPGLLRLIADELDRHDRFHQSPRAVQLRHIARQLDGVKRRRRELEQAQMLVASLFRLCCHRY